jgi:hypothetical protein
MSILGIGSIVETVGNLIGDMYTSDKERMDAQLEQDKLALEGRKVDASLQIAQTEVNKEEAKSSSLFVSGWRPAVGWSCVCGLVYQFLFCPIFGWMASNISGWSLPPSLDTDTLMTLLFGILGLGVYRTAEKFKGVSR